MSDRQKKGVVLTRKGFDYSLSFSSIKAASRAVGRSGETVKARCNDGLWLHTDNGIAVKVRFI